MPIGRSVGQGGVNRAEDVRLVQQLLNNWRGKNFLPSIAVDGFIGPQTIGAIRVFQQRVTGIVDGRVDPNGPAIRALEEVEAGPGLGEVAVAILVMLRDLDSRVAQTGGRLPLKVTQGLTGIQEKARALAPPGAGDPAFFRFSPPMALGLRESRTLVAAAPVVIVGGVALTAAQIALILAIVALMAILALSVISPEFREKATELKMEIIKTATEAIVESMLGVEALRAAIEQCRRISAGNTNPKCAQALAEFAAKVAEIVITRTALQQLISQMAADLSGIPNLTNLRLAKALVEEMAKQRAELIEIARRIMVECGCQFIRI